MRNPVFTEAPELEILFQDDYLVAINKPSGLLVHRSEIDKRETLFALQITRDQIGQRVYPIHRLDRPTSGVLLFALDSHTAKLMSEQFASGTVQKTYMAMVRGFTQQELLIDYPLKLILDKKSDKDKNKEQEAKEAVTQLTTIATIELPFASGRYQQSRFSLVKLQPKTGRKHQLRRHMAHIRHPIIGDTNHGDGKQNTAAREHLELNRLALTATELTFVHPYSNEPITIQAPLDTTLSRIFNLFNAVSR